MYPFTITVYKTFYIKHLQTFPVDKMKVLALVPTNLALYPLANGRITDKDLI